uniref:CNNM transmembrane domain-containing protein n=1 Tax=Strongyloides venezuelensis TaxID=75913 RepID=A0A0K0FBG7_STRVS
MDGTEAMLPQEKKVDNFIVTSPSFQKKILNHEEIHFLTVDLRGEQAETASVIRKRDRLRARIRKLRQNQCVGICVFLALGLIFNGLAYLASVYSAHLNNEIIEAVVASQNSKFGNLQLKLKKALQGTPSKFLIGLINWVGRMLSAVGTMLLVQSVVTFLKRRRSNSWVTKAASNTDINDPVNEINGGISEMLGECCLQCFSAGA